MPLTPESIDALLPQTQCGLCGYGGCMPYAEAIANKNAAINLCPPGGVTTLKALAELANQDPSPFIAEMETKSKPKTLAVIREAECIGCTKCIQACPVDAILGAAKLMHSVISSECTGCELCIPACPVDCIDLIVHTNSQQTLDPKITDHYRMRFNARQNRLQQEVKMKQSQLEARALRIRKNYVAAAIARVKAKKNQT